MDWAALRVWCRVWCRAARAVRAFPRGTRRVVWRSAQELAREALQKLREPPALSSGRMPTDSDVEGGPGLRSTERRRSNGRGFWPGFGETLGPRHCDVCCTDDMALEGWVAIAGRALCADCGRAALAGVMPYGRLRAAYRGRVGSPRRSLGEAYHAVVAFKERHGDWAALAEPLARALAGSVEALCADADTEMARVGGRPLLVPVPAYRERRPHMRLLVALAALQLPRVSVQLDVLAKTRDFTQKGLSRQERLAESAGAYVVRSGRRARVRDRHIIVADDLVTTGTTLESCAHALRAAGAAQIDGVSIVRVIRAPPERVVSVGSRQARLQLRELDGRGRAPVMAAGGSLWVQFACSARCPVTIIAGPYPLPCFDAVGHHRWMCRCGASHSIRVRREWRGATHDSIAVAVGDRRPREILVGTLQGSPAYVS